MKALNIAVLLLVVFSGSEETSWGRGLGSLRKRHHYQEITTEILSQVLALRAQSFKKRFHIEFDANTDFKVKSELFLDGKSEVEAYPTAQYFYEDQSVRFKISSIRDMSMKFASRDPTMLATDPWLGRIMDHELGHLLMDQVSRRNKLGAWCSNKHFYSVKEEEQFGLRILSEGVAEYFGRTYSQAAETFSFSSFPKDEKDRESYAVLAITYDGGYWLLKPILSQYGEKGLLWIVKHPFVATKNLRDAAISYQRKALSELSEKML